WWMGPDDTARESSYRGSGPPAWADGPLGLALRLDGREDSFLDAGQAVSLERTDRFSFGCWVKPRRGGTCLSKMDDGDAHCGFDLLLVNGKVEVHLVHAWPNNALKVATREALPRGEWAHVFVTYDGSSKAAGVKVYVNGRPSPLEVQANKLRD